MSISQNGSFYELRDQLNELVQTSTDAGVLANAALALFPNGGCSIVFGPGTFNCSQITINQSNTTIEGNGYATIIQPIGNNSIFYFTSSSGNGLNPVRIGNFTCKDPGLMTGASAFFFFNAVAGLTYILVNSEFHDLMFTGSLNRAFYDGGGTGNYLTGQVINQRFVNINIDGSAFANAFFSVMNLRQSIFEHGILSTTLTNNSSLIALGVGTSSTIACLTTFEDIQAYIGPSTYTGTAIVLNNVDGVHFNDVAIRFSAPPNSNSIGMSIAGSLGEMVFNRLTIYSANVGILFTSSSDIGFTYLANGSVFLNCAIMRCNTSIKAVSDSSTKFFIGGQLLPAGSNFNPNPLTGTLQMFHVQGVDPIGASAITAGASPFTYTNNDGVPEMVYIYGGTITSPYIQKNSRTIFQSGPAAVWLEPGEQVVITYTTAPTLSKDQKG